MLETMSAIAHSFNSELINSVKAGKKFRIVGDNINFHLGVAKERKSVGKTGHMEHWFGSAAVVQNISFSELSELTPQMDLRNMPIERFLISEPKWSSIIFDLSSLAAKSLVEFFPWLNFARSAVHEGMNNIPDCMKEESKVIPLPILHKNEQKYSEVVDILDSYQELCEGVYQAAEEPLPKIHIGGDLLTRERFSGAKKLRAAALTESERFCSLNPITFELFHLQMSVLAAFYQLLYNECHCEPFTLYSQKIRLLRKDANGNDVKNHYDSCKDLAESVIKAYVVEAACEHFGLPNTDAIPENIPVSENMTPDEIRIWLLNQVTPIITKVTSASRNVLSGTYVESNKSDVDVVHSYGNILLEIGLLFIYLCDVVKNPNRDRLLILMKYLLLVLKGNNNKSKYSLDILRFLCQQLAILSEKRAHEVFYGLFVNTGRTVIPADLQMEHLVRLTKCHLRSMCSNVTDQSLVKRSSAFFGMQEVSKVFDEETFVIKRAHKHKRLLSFEDEKKIIHDLRAVRPFLMVHGRHPETLKKAPKNPITKLNMDAFKQWIESYKIRFYYEL